MKKLLKRKRGKEDTAILYQRTKGERVVYGVMFFLFLIYAASLVFPLIYMIINSLESSLDYTQKLINGNVLSFPKKMHFENYSTALDGMFMVDSVGRNIYLPEMFFNSLWYCICLIGEGIFMSCCTGYVLSKYRFKTKKFIYACVIFSMTLPIVGTTGANFKLMSDLGIYNSPFYAIITGCGGFGFSFLVMYGFFKSVSWSYAEAVFIDGGGHYSVFFRIMLPQAMPIAITLCITNFIGVWNDYMTPLLYLPDYPTVASGIYRIGSSFTRAGDRPAYFAGLVISMLPVLAVFIGCSNIIMKNMAVGGLKG